MIPYTTKTIKNKTKLLYLLKIKIKKYVIKYILNFLKKTIMLEKIKNVETNFFFEKLKILGFTAISLFAQKSRKIENRFSKLNNSRLYKGTIMYMC